MAATEVNGNHEAMSAIAPQITAPPMPPSMARLATPPNLTGLPEGIAMSLLDKAATGVLTAFIGKITQDLVTYEILGEDDTGRIKGKHIGTGIVRPHFWERARYYNLTVAGRKQLAEEEKSWARLTQAVAHVLQYA